MGLLPRTIEMTMKIAVTSISNDKYGWLLLAPFAWKKTCSIAPVVYLGGILGGSAVIFWRVSSIYEREGMIVAPVMVWSQYLRF